MPPVVPLVISLKPALPTLWIDTSVVIKLTKIERGESLQDIEIQRGSRLRRLVSKLVRAGKLLCPESDQEEEYVAQRLDDNVHRMFSSLSLGIFFTHRQGIFDEHVSEGMKAYANKASKVELPSSTYFQADPIRRLEEVRQQKFFATVGPFKGAELLKRRADAKAETAAKWEELRQKLVASGRTYEQQLELEQRGYADTILDTIRKFELNLSAGHLNFWEFMGVAGPYKYERWWHQLGAQPQGWVGVHSFFCSTYFNELPLEFIGCRLCADLVIGNQPIAPGDPMDVELLSVAIPVAHYVLTDRRMEQRIKRLGLETRWATAVFSMSSIDGLFAELERLANQ